MSNPLPNWKDRRHARLTEPEVKEIVESWRSGRLVDCEAIDYEAGTEALRREHQRIHNIMDADDYWGYLTDLATAAVDAAIGDNR